MKFISLLMLVILVSCGSGEGSYNLEVPNLRGPDLKISGEYLEISMVFEEVVGNKALRYQIPNYQNSYLELMPDLHSSGTLLKIYMAKKDLTNPPQNKMSNQYLPGGQNIPEISSGMLPSMAFSTEQFPLIAFYHKDKQFGLWLPLANDLKETILTADYYSNNVKVGKLSLVGANSEGEHAGMFLLLRQ